MEKMKSLFIGNCQNNGAMHFLSFSKEFTETYDIKQYPNWQLIKNNCQVPMNDIQNADLFIYQPLGMVHGCYPTDPSVEGSVGYYVKDSCIKIAYPYIFSSAMWPLVQKDKNINVWFGGEVITKLLSENYTKSDILNLYYEGKIDWDYKNRFQNSLNILKEKEKLTDIKVSNFIEKNLLDNLLFLIPHHPTSIIFFYVANEILKKIGMEELDESVVQSINDCNLYDSTYDHPLCMHPLHESLIQNFNLNYGSEYLMNSEQFYADRIKTFLELNNP